MGNKMEPLGMMKELEAITNEKQMSIELCKQQIAILEKRIVDLKGLPEWLIPVSIGCIRLRREGDHTLVDVEIDRVYKLAIKERFDSNFSHEITASGIRGLKAEGQP